MQQKLLTRSPSSPRRIRLQVEPTQLCDAVQAAVQHADAKGRRGNIEVETRVPPALPLAGSEDAL